MKNLALIDNPALLLFKQQLSTSEPIKPKHKPSAKIQARTKAPVIQMRTRVPEGSDKALTLAKEQILATAKRWGKSGTEEHIQDILVSVMASHGVDAANRIIMETKLNKFGWQAQVA